MAIQYKSLLSVAEVISKRAPSGRDPRLRGKVLYITRVKQTMIIYKHNTAKDYDYVHIIGHLCV